MPNDAPGPEPAELEQELLAITERARAHAEQDPFGNPVLASALAISRLMDEGELDAARIAAVIRRLRDAAFLQRAARLAAYVGGTDPGASAAAIDALAARLIRPDPADSPVPYARFREAAERTRFSAVFTAHPTFALPPEVARALAGAACGVMPERSFPSHRPARPTLAEEFEQARAAIGHGRDALDQLTAALLTHAGRVWPDRWTELCPRPITVASWVGYDTDGRTDIGWWDTLRYRLLMKQLQLERLRAQLGGIAAAEALAARVEVAAVAVAEQIAACPRDGDPVATQGFAAALIGGREAALTGTASLDPLFAAAIRAAAADERLRLAVARAGFTAHGLSLAHTHVRLNASQVHNAIRLRLGLENPPADRSRRRVLLTAINAALEQEAVMPVDFGALIAEQSSATKLMMTVAQILKHIDRATPVRFLIAETETGFTLLCALYLARLFGIEERVEISPLFETPEALQAGARVVEEALRSPQYRDHLRRTGRLAVQFGYSDSGRYVGQLDASYLIERLRLKLAELLPRYGLEAVELILFDTHGESIGRGAHPGSLADRLRYLSPEMARRSFAEAGIRTREESSFQGQDGYLLFGTPELALASVARIAEHAFAAPPAEPDPIYQEADFAADFFATIGLSMQGLVEDPGYAALLGAFGPALLDPTGSRPAARQSDGMAGPAIIRHPRELRAILNNAILHQLGWCANTLQGVGTAASRQPEAFSELRGTSTRFRRALDFPDFALCHSDLDVLHAIISLLDPGSWLDRAGHARRPGRARRLIEIARALERLDLWAQAQAMFRRIQADHVRLREVWPDAPAMTTEEMLLHALRIALIGRIWLLATDIPEFSPRFGMSRDALTLRILQLDVPGALAALAQIFPAAPDPAAGLDYGEPRSPSAAASYQREQEAILAPIGQLFDQVREISTAVTHHVGAFG